MGESRGSNIKGDNIKVFSLGASKPHEQKLVSQERELGGRSRRVALADSKLMMGPRRRMQQAVRM